LTDDYGPGDVIPIKGDIGLVREDLFLISRTDLLEIWLNLITIKGMETVVGVQFQWD